MKNWCYIKIKNILSKDIIKQVKNQATEWEKIFAVPLSDKGLIVHIKNYTLIAEQKPGTVDHICNSSTLGGQSRRITWAQEVKIAVSHDCATALQLRDRMKLCLKKKRKEEEAEEEKEETKNIERFM